MERTHIVSRLSKAHVKHLHERKHHSEHRKKHLITYLEQLKETCKKGVISYSKYLEIIHLKRNGRTIEEWIHFYHHEAIECERKIQKYLHSKSKKRFFIYIAAIIVLIAIFSFVLNNSRFAGFVAQENQTMSPFQDFSEQLNLKFSKSDIYEWTPENKGNLSFVSLSGMIEESEDSNIKIYLDDILILDSSNIKESKQRTITALAVDETETDSDSSDSSSTESTDSSSETSQSDQTEGAEEESTQESFPDSESAPPESEEENQQGQETPENETSGEENVTETPKEETSGEESKKIIKDFENFCQDTCDLKELNLSKDSYKLRIEISGNAQIRINRIRYGIIKEISEGIPENETEIIETPEANATITTTQERAVIGQPVKWTKKVELDYPSTVTITLPADAENITAYKIDEERDISEVSISGMAISDISGNGIITRFWNFFKRIFASITGRAIEPIPEEIEITLNDNATDYEVEYYTEAPQAFEENISNGKRITITGPDELHYIDVLAFSELPREIELSKIKLYHIENNKKVETEFTAYDNNENGLIDYIEWDVPHLSEKIYEIILVVYAEHLNSDREFIEDITDYVTVHDNNWTAINNNEYVRVRFEKNLTSENDITIYARGNKNNINIEVYEQNNTEIIATFTEINSEGFYKIFLENLSENQDTFDLKIVSNNPQASVEFDHIIDPTLLTVNGTFFENWETGNYVANNWTIINGPTSGWYVTTTEGPIGTYHAIARNTDGESSLNNYISTAGYENISFDFWWATDTNGFDTGEYFYADWYNGTTWTNLFSFTTGTQTAYTLASYNLSSSANNNVNFAIRFICNVNLGTEGCDVDNITLRGDSIPDTVPIVNLISPANNTTSSLNYIDFLCNATDDIQLQNITLYWNYNGTWASNETKNISGIFNQSNFSKTNLSPSFFQWNCLACDNLSQCSFANQNYTYNLSEANEPPIDPAPVINSTNGLNLSSENLNCFSNISDPEEDNLNVTVQWYKNDALNLTVDYNNSYASGSFFNSILEPGNLSVGDVWKCGMRLYDGVSYSNWINSSNITIRENITAIFYDDFESGISKWNRTTTGAAQNWSVETTDPYEGSYHAEANPQSSGDFSILYVNISTYGYQNITFSYYRKLIGLDVTDAFNVRWYNGTDWEYLENNVYGDDADYVYQNFSLTNNSWDNKNFQIQFECSAGAVSEYCRLDNVKIEGIKILRDEIPITYLLTPSDNYINTSASPAEINFACSATDEENLVNLSLYLTNSSNQSFSLNQTTNISGLTNSSSWIINLTNGNYTWNCLACDNSSQCSFASSNRSIKINYDATKPQVTLINPPNNYVNDIRDVNFTCSVTDDIQINNVTFYWDYNGTWTSNGTTNLSGISNQTNFSRSNLSNGNYKWNCLACDNDSQCQFSERNFTIIIDIPADMINLFFDGFESGNLNNWTLSHTGTASDWQVSTIDPYEGNDHAIAINTGSGYYSIMEIGVSTLNYNNISVSYYRKLIGLDITDGFTSSWFNGTVWIPMESDVDGNDADYVYQNFTLPADAWNNPNFRLKFECSAGAVSEACELDNVKVRGYNEAPKITYVSPIPNTNPIELNKTSVTFYATAYDFNGVGDIQKVNATFSKINQTTRDNSSCVKIGNIDSKSANYSCSINMWYWDGAGDWNISVYGYDKNNRIGTNNTTYFQYNLLQAITVYPNNLTFNASSNQINATAINDPIKINNTGNANLTEKISINATNLLGEDVPTTFISASNISVGLSTGGFAECAGTTLQNATAINITGVQLQAGNLSAGQAQEELYFCIKQTPDIAQTYSTQGYGSWFVKIISSLVIVSIAGKKKKRKIMLDEISIPSTIFTDKIGGLEALAKYMKENLGLSYHEIALLLNRNDRTIWTAYKKSTAKMPEKINITKTLVHIPTSILKNRKLTVFEAIVVYLKNKGMKYVEIADLLNRDQRNIWTIYNRAVKK